MSPPTDLPFLERKSLDFSVASTMNRCPRLAYFNYGINRAARAENYPINFGVAYHRFREVLENLYRKRVTEDGEDLEKIQDSIYAYAYASAVTGWTDPPLEHRKSYLDLGRITKTCEEGFEMWLNEKRSNYYKVIATETAFELPIVSPDSPPLRWVSASARAGSFSFERDLALQFSGRLDQILEWNGRLWVRDFKTVGRKEDWRAKFNPDHQFTGYVWAAQKLSGRPVDGVIVDVVYNIKSTGPEFHPVLASRSSYDIEHWLEWVQDSWEDYQKYIQKDSWPMRTMACNDWGGCFFRECCNLGSWDSMGRWLEERTIHSVWDPTAPEKEVGLPE